MKANHTLYSLLISFGFLFLLACSPILKVNADYDKKVDFSKFKTFSFYGFTDKGSNISELNRNRVISSITAEMKTKGFIESSENPDFLVNATTVVKEKSQVSSTNYYGYGGVYRPYYWGPGYTSNNVNVYNYHEGSLIIDVIDASKQTLIWQGIGNSEIDVPLKNPDEFISNAVRKILLKFPPTQKQ